MNLRLTSKRALGRAWRASETAAGRRLILLYHSIGSGPWATREDVFRDQMTWLRDHAEVAPAEDLVGRAKSDTLSIGISFDDGYACLHKTALPILDAIGFPATVFINTGWITDRDRRPSDPSQGHYPGESFLVWPEIQDLLTAGWSVGSHGVNHLDLTKVDTGVAQRELTQSRTEIERRLARPCGLFAYTWGRHSVALRQLVAAAGYDLAFASNHRPVQPGMDMLAIPRINIARDYTLADFVAIVLGRWDFLGLLHRARASVS